MVVNNDKRTAVRFYVFLRKRLSAHMWISRGHVTRVKQVSRIASSKGTRAGCREMISLLRESRERSIGRNDRWPDSAASSCTKPWRGNETVYTNVGTFEFQSLAEFPSNGHQTIVLWKSIVINFIY